jgi:uncharacterized tellurite resistance protein B-like protein
MLAALRDFFDQRLARRPDESAGTTVERARIAAAALLVEVVQSDAEFSTNERTAVLASVSRHAGLASGAAAELIELAEAEAREAHDTWQFTSRINGAFTLEEKRRLIEELWRVAYADDVLHRHEEHLIRRVSDLLHLGHKEFIRAKLRVEAEALTAGGSSGP